MLDSSDSPLPDTEVHHLVSEQVGDTYKILVGQGGPSDAGARPVVFVSDVSFLFGTAVDIARLLSFAEHLPPLLVVGIGYRTSAVAEALALRQRDFTPSVDATRGDLSDPAMIGGADRFLGFIQLELKPWLSERYGVDPDDSAFIGVSLGGLFATHVLFSAPSTFRRYGIGSPAYWWDDGLMFKREAEYAESHTDLPARVHVSVGEYETPEGMRHYREQLPPDERAKAEAAEKADPMVDMVADAERVVTSLRGRGYPSLDVGFEILPAEYHATAPPLSVSRSLRRLFGAPR